MVKGFIVILVVIGKRTISVLDIITDFYYNVKYYFYLFFGGAMRIGSLVKWISPFAESLEVHIGVVVCLTAIQQGQGHTYRYWVVNFGKFTLQLEQDDLEVICE